MFAPWRNQMPSLTQYRGLILESTEPTHAREKVQGRVGEVQIATSVDAQQLEWKEK